MWSGLKAFEFGCELGDKGLGFKVSGLGFRFGGLGFRFGGLGFRVCPSKRWMCAGVYRVCRACSIGFRIED